MSSAQIVSAGAIQNNHLELNQIRPYPTKTQVLLMYTSLRKSY